MTRRLRVRVTGTVQGVGFRPYVHRLATELRLAGCVGNDAAGVWLEIEGPSAKLDEFLQRLPNEAPPMARVVSVSVESELPVTNSNEFTIELSTDDDPSAASTALPPDTALCANCRREVLNPGNRRYRHPFITCTDCGPRFTITESLPYDRPRTTMADFPMCELCSQEYHDPSDRRFHAQPIACPDCGPRVRYLRGIASFEDETALAAAIFDIHTGLTVAVKGLGGYHLACNADDAKAVDRLRTRKQRGNKPFAVLVRDLEAARELADISDAEAQLLTAPESPIVLVRPRESARARAMAAAVAPGNGRLGIMLPPTALHLLLLSPHPDLPQTLLSAVVLTSGNVSDEPICIGDAEAQERLADLADAFLFHNRGIHLPCDDSVVRVTEAADGSLMQPVRRSRGYAPAPLPLVSSVPPTLAVGGELKTAICVADGNRAWLSQHIGDTGDLSTLNLLDRVAELLSDLQRVRPERYVADLHPGYLSRKWAETHASANGAELVLVQHHHAHLGSLLAEQQVPMGEPVLGVAFDGTGYGTDGAIWGGEFLLGSYGSYERVASLAPVRLPGGDAAVKRPARIALAHLQAAGLVFDPSLPPVAACEGTELQVVSRLLESGTSCVPTTSMGRLFDAVSALAGVAQDAEYEGQAAIEFEALAEAAPERADGVRYRISLERGAERWLLQPAPLLAAVARDVLAGVGADRIGLAFHEALADAVLSTALKVRQEHGVNKVGLTGGVFQNGLLTRLCAARLAAAGFEVLVHRLVPPNDGGLALGQVLIASGQIH